MDDHLVISIKDYYSFAVNGLMDRLADSIRYVPNFKLEDRIRSEERLIRWEIEIERKDERRKDRE